MKRLPLFLSICLLAICSTFCTAQELPIKPTRTISFTTDEGSYMNVDVSPDGKTLVFDLLGDLYTVPVTGGKATQLTRGMALNLRPVWSPDGKKIAYISDISGDFHLNVIDNTGKRRMLLGEFDNSLEYRADARWTTDGNYIAVGDHVYSLINRKKLHYAQDIRHPLRFSTDGELIYYVDSSKLYCYNRLTKHSTCLSATLRGSEFELSPDAHWLAYLVDSNFKSCLVVRNVENSQERLMTSSLERYVTYKLFAPRHFSFSPDSKHIFISYGGKIHQLEVKTGDDQIIPFKVNVNVDAGPFDYNTFGVSNDSFKVAYTRSINASPDGKHLVFSALDRIYAMDIASGKTHPIVKQPINQFQPAYSPDGQWIAYVSWCDTVGGYLWKVPAAGGEPQRLTQLAGQYQHPTWSPDGKLIAVIRGEPKLGDRDDQGRGQLEVISVNDHAVHVIEDTVPLWNHLSFSMDGTRIIYEPKPKRIPDPLNPPLAPQLVSKDLDGNNLEIVAIGRQKIITDLFCQQRTISPDGRYLVYAMGEDLYIVPICKFFDPPQIYDKRENLSAIRFARGIDPYWDVKGKALCWTYGRHFFKIDPDKIILAAKKTRNENLISNFSDSDIITLSIKPDKIISINIEVPNFYAHGFLALKDIRIITMQKNKVIEHGTVVIKNGRFWAVGPSESTSIPETAKIIHLPGATVMPGIVDLHSHMRIPSDIFPQQSWMYLANLAYGVTTVRDPSLSFDSYGYSELLKSGQMLGPRLYTVGRSVNPVYGLRCNSLNDARAIVSKRAIMGGIAIKQYTLDTRLQKEWLLMATHEAGLNMTNEGLTDPILQIGMMKDGSTGVEHNPVWGDIYSDIIKFVAKSGVWFTPTLQVCYGREEGREYFNYKYWHQPDPKRIRFTSIEQLKKTEKCYPTDTIDPGFLYPSTLDAQIRKYGGRVTLGSHGEDQGIGAHSELWALQMGGLTNMEALQAATIMGAEGLGVQKDLGSIEVGKIADLIVLNKNPLDDIHNSREIRYVMKDGVLYDGDTLDEIWPIAKKCPEWRMKGGGD